jgi:hypothetical protein
LHRDCKAKLLPCRNIQVAHSRLESRASQIILQAFCRDCVLSEETPVPPRERPTLERAAGPSPRDGSVLLYAQHVIIPGPRLLPKCQPSEFSFSFSSAQPG